MLSLTSYVSEIFIFYDFMVTVRNFQAKIFGLYLEKIPEFFTLELLPIPLASICNTHY